jgi:hypothetical protein
VPVSAAGKRLRNLCDATRSALGVLHAGLSRVQDNREGKGSSVDRQCDTGIKRKPLLKCVANFFCLHSSLFFPVVKKSIVQPVVAKLFQALQSSSLVNVNSIRKQVARDFHMGVGRESAAEIPKFNRVHNPGRKITSTLYRPAGCLRQVFERHGQWNVPRQIF